MEKETEHEMEIGVECLDLLLGRLNQVTIMGIYIYMYFVKIQYLTGVRLYSTLILGLAATQIMARTTPSYRSPLT